MKEPKCWLSEHPRIEATDEFISKSNLTLNHTQDELVQRMKDIESDDFFGFQRQVILEFLEFEPAKVFYKTEYTEKVASGEIQHTYVTDIKEAAQDFLDYMNFAWGKAEDERGISASRSIDKLGEWLWILGRDDLRDLIHQDDLYNPYGAPALIAVCDALSISVPDSLKAFAKVRAAY